jgi:hypothetical protein
MTNYTHTAESFEYNGVNPNNCDCCGQVSATFIFKPVDVLSQNIKLCHFCRTKPVDGFSNAYLKFNIKPNLSLDNIEKICWYPKT